MNDIQSIEDIRLMVDTFYESIRKDQLLGPIFNERIGNRWPEHLQKMYSFWQTILLQEHTYSGTPFSPHASMPISKEHFERWVTLFNDNIDSLFHGSIANEAKSRAALMANLFLSKINYIRDNPSFHSIQ